MFLNFLSKKKTAPKDLDNVMEAIKIENYDEALYIALENMPHEPRIKYVAKILTESHFRINSAALQIFNETIDKYLKEKNPKILDQYLIRLSNETRNTNFSSHSGMFSMIRTNVINDLRNNNSVLSAESIIQTFRIENYLDKDEKIHKDFKRRYKSAVIDVVSTVWPSQSMLKVLYG